TRLDKGRSLNASELLWIGALGLAALPTFVAPALAAAGLSLRPEPAPIDPSIYLMAAAASAASVPAAATAAPRIGPETIFAAAGLIYVYGVLLAFGLWAARAAAFHIAMRRAEPIDHPELVAAVARWSRRLDVSRPLDIRV